MGIVLKICGIRRPEDVAYLNASPPDYAGFVFAPSRRRVTIPQARALGEALRRDIARVGVFVNAPPEEAARTAKEAGLDILQLHGDEDAPYLARLRALAGLPLWKAVRVRGEADILAADGLGADALLLDAFSPAAYGGTGRVADWGAVARARERIGTPFLLAGGLNAGNLRQAVSSTRPWGVDVSGGVESSGVKDEGKLRSLLELARGL